VRIEGCWHTLKYATANTITDVHGQGAGLNNLGKEKQIFATIDVDK
jgi:hypothetical protein